MRGRRSAVPSSANKTSAERTTSRGEEGDDISGIDATTFDASPRDESRPIRLWTDMKLRSTASSTVGARILAATSRAGWSRAIGSPPELGAKTMATVTRTANLALMNPSFLDQPHQM